MLRILAAAVAMLGLASCWSPTIAPASAPAGPATPPEGFVASAGAQIGAALTVSHLALQGASIESGWYSTAGAPPMDGAGWGTYGQAKDAGTGAIGFDVAVPADTHALVIPVVTGPTLEHLTVQVSIKGGSEVLALRPPPNLSTWQAWRVDLPADFAGGTLRVEASDQGAGWGEWVAIGTPHAFTP